MATITNYTVKAANGTTDVVFVALSGSKGDNTPAIWRVEDAARPIGARIRSTVTTKSNARKNARQAVYRVTVPVLRTVSGDLVQVGTIPVELSATMGDQFTQAEIDDAIAIALNGAAVTIIRSGFTSGFAPT